MSAGSGSVNADAAGATIGGSPADTPASDAEVAAVVAGLFPDERRRADDGSSSWRCSTKPPAPAWRAADC